jgi:hypothetical protein
MRKKRMLERQVLRNTAAKIIAAALACVLFAGIGAAQPEAPDLEALLKRIAIKSADDVAYEERRYLGALTTPLVSRGHLRFEPPDRLIKKVEAPRRETAVAERDRLAVLNGEGVEIASMDLAANNDLRLLFDGLRGVLSGDAAALRSAFDARLAGDAKEWRIELTPKAAGGDTRMRSIVVTGAGERIESFEIRERGGDRSHIRLLPSPQRP